ncbi:MAG TPA: hypothetical protein VHE37_03245 [Nevskiaceae bacterium]|nr:hypothetical protein [Nevskiaceae bacterium]
MNQTEGHGSSPEAAEDPRASLVNQAARLLQDSQLDAAQELLAQALQRFPRYARAHQLQANLAGRRGHWRTSLEHWRIFLKLKPAHLAGYVSALACAAQLDNSLAAEEVAAMAPGEVAARVDFQMRVRLPVLRLRQQVDAARTLIGALDEATLDAAGSVEAAVTQC